MTSLDHLSPLGPSILPGLPGLPGAAPRRRRASPFATAALAAAALLACACDAAILPSDSGQDAMSELTLAARSDLSAETAAAADPATWAPLAAPAAYGASPVSGFADLHFHMMSEAAFGGGWLHGKHDGPGALDDCDGGMPESDHARVRQDLSGLLASCPQSTMLDFASNGALSALLGIGGGVLGSEAIGKTEGTQGDTGLHLQRKRLSEGWPRWDTIAHQQGHVSWLRSAHDRGLSLIVMSAVSYDWLCSILPEQNRERACDEMADVDLQLQMTHALVARNAGWMEIALSPAHARQIVGAGKLAVVLSIEASHLFGRDVDAARMRAQLDKYQALGVRTLQPVHQVDNAFSGAALHNPIFQFAQYTETCFIDTDCGATLAGVTLGMDVDASCNNMRGLTPLGEQLVGEMMDRGMLIDVAHMSERGVDRVFDLARARDYYPMYVSHGHFREIMGPKVAETEKSTPARVIRMLRQTGGMFGLRTAHDETKQFTRSSVENSCQGSSRSFAQAYDYGRLGLKVPMAFGADLNGFIQQTRPRFGEDGACSAAFQAEADCQAWEQREQGPGPLGTEFDEKGLAHEGMLPDLVADLERLGVDTTGLRSSTESFLRMWERAAGPRAGMADPAADMDEGGVAPFVPAEERELAYPTKCGAAYCPGFQELGGGCRFDEECESGQCTAVACNAIPGRCVCNDDADCDDSVAYCALKTPGIGGDNECVPDKGDHAVCTRDGQCASGRCGGLIAGAGWCYTPGSKAIGQGCRVNEECPSNRCGDLTQTCLCRSDAHCGASQFCGWGTNEGECVNKRGRGAACTKDNQCQSGNCRFLFCR
ncbi:peptidase M19 [Sorangium cellulosum So0157-2]|uniref:Peptidase M19 n=3 Tax=Sorangium cellulosum TaxID=56 RepID=S4XLL0_SORCE|nr:peptidase M19 [Sorangium cellulosum So0157-2]